MSGDHGQRFENSRALSKEDIKAISRELICAEESCSAVDRLTKRYPDMTVKDAYDIQRETITKKLERGARIIGSKIGLTSHAMQSLLGVGEPDYGLLLDSMAVPEGEGVERSSLIMPKAEGEVAFVLGRGLEGPGLTATDVLCATEAVVPAIEIVDSRVRNWDIRIQDTVADNASSARLVLGGKLSKPMGIDLRLVGMAMFKNGVLLSTGAGAAVLGHPAYAIAWLGNKLAEFGLKLEAGQVLLSGAVTAAVDVRSGDVIRVEFDRLGSVITRFA